MQCFAQALDLVDDPELIRVYEEHHRAVWPKVVAALRAAGIVRMRIFRHGTRLFMYCECPDGFDPARDYQQYALDPECRKWDELMRRFQRPVPGAPAGAWWAPMDLVFDLESCPGARTEGAAG
jgi:L-rhamnose mutarotase